MRKVMFALAIAVGALMVLQPANAQMTDPVNTRTSIGRYHGRAPSTGVHWCTWSAATVCSKWRARGGKYICPPGDMSASCQLQRRTEAQVKR